MATAPQTWTILKGIQSIIQAEVRVGGVSPYSAFSASDATKYGSTNAIYLGDPKDVKPSLYPNQCWIIPPAPEHIYHRSGIGATGSIVWQEQHITLIHLFNYRTDYYGALQACMNATDALVPVLMRHVDSGYGPTVAAAKLVENKAGYLFREFAGNDFFCWTGTLWLKQQWQISGGVVS